MSDIHITPELLEAVERGDLPARVLVEVGWKHLMNLCSTCRSGFEMWQRRRSAPSADYETFRVLPVLLERHTQEAQEKQQRAERDLQELLALPQEERLSKVQRATTRFKGVMLAHMLVTEARKHVPSAPRAVQELAEIAEAVLLRTPHAPGYFDALTRAMAYKANALRAMGNLPEASQRMKGVRTLLRQEEVTDTVVYAETDWFEGILRKDQRRFREAEELLKRAASLFRLAGQTAEAARPLLTLGLLYNEERKLSQALEATRGALEQISPQSDPMLYCYARHNLSLFLVEAGYYEEAEASLREHRDLYSQYPDWYTQSRLTWIQGKIAAGLGRFQEAEQAFRALRDGFAARGNDYDAAMVSKDLARVSAGRAGGL